MKKTLALIALSLAFSSTMLAEDDYEEGLLTSYLNRFLERTMEKKTDSEGEEKPSYGRHLSDYVSAPKFGGYVIGKYTYSDLGGAHGGSGFDARMIRAYVSGTILRDFKYRVQIELKNTPSMRDYTLEWVRWEEFQVKVGQFKRGFSYDNAKSAWQQEMGDFTQLSKRFCALAGTDYSGEPSQSGRDIGLQLKGDLLPVGKDHHRLFRYQAAIYNGNGLNTTDNNRKKDFIGSIHLQPIRDLYLGFFGWKGNYTKDNVSVDRNRWSLGLNYDHEDWTLRAEYAHHKGHNVNDYDAKTGTWSGKAKADAWYVMAGIPVTRWFKPIFRYDVYRADQSNSTATSVYCFCTNFSLHKDLMLQMQYNYVNDRRNPSDKNHNELMASFWVRF